MEIIISPCLLSKHSTIQCKRGKLIQVNFFPAYCSKRRKHKYAMFFHPHLQMTILFAMLLATKLAHFWFVPISTVNDAIFKHAKCLIFLFPLSRLRQIEV